MQQAIADTNLAKIHNTISPHTVTVLHIIERNNWYCLRICQWYNIYQFDNTSFHRCSPSKPYVMHEYSLQNCKRPKFWWIWCEIVIVIVIFTSTCRSSGQNGTKSIHVEVAILLSATEKRQLLLRLHINDRVCTITVTRHRRHGLQNHPQLDCLFNSLLRLSTTKHHEALLAY